MTGAHYADVDDEAAWRWVHGRIEQLPVIRLVFRFPNVKAAARERLRRWVLKDVFDEFATAYQRVQAERDDVRRRSAVLIDAHRRNTEQAASNAIAAADNENKAAELAVLNAELFVREAALNAERSRLAHPANQPPATGTQEQTP